MKIVRSKFPVNFYGQCYMITSLIQELTTPKNKQLIIDNIVQPYISFIGGKMLPFFAVLLILLIVNIVMMIYMILIIKHKLQS